MSNEQKLPTSDSHPFDEKAWLKERIAQLDVDQMKKDYSEYQKDKYVLMENLLDELDVIAERVTKDSA